jgi:hypothetical protein
MNLWFLIFVDFMFQITGEEKDKPVTICDRLSSLKNSSINPSVFSAHSAVMLYIVFIKNFQQT